uniref:Oxoglutarate (alpha-ketoglutarate) receptor 1a, tandem duplicate 2 n=1 Tax=Xiphophorus maculatus TaxID=8083 RepID=A0A3B5R405_XIPMA
VVKIINLYFEFDSCTDLEVLLKRYYLSVAYGVIFVVGLVGNITSIGIYLTKLRPWKSSSIIMVNLALTDLFYVLSMPFLVYYYSNGESWMLGDFMCRFVRFAFHFHLYGSILSLSCVAVFRFLVVIQPLRVVEVQQKVWGIVACLVVWIVSAAEVTPMFECNQYGLTFPLILSHSCAKFLHVLNATRL